MRLLTGTATVTDLDDAVADLDAVGDRHGCTLQAFDARAVAGPAHLRRAVTLADRARDRGEGIARDRAVEILLYAAGRRQIDRALAMGLDEGETPAVVVVSATPETTAADDGRPAETPLDAAAEVPVHEARPETGAGEDGNGSAATRERAAVAAVCDRPWFAAGPVTFGDPERLREFFEVGAAELAATDASLADLVGERVALLVVER